MVRISIFNIIDPTTEFIVGNITPVISKILSIIVNKIAIIILEHGPAKAVNALPAALFLKFLSSIITGFPQPNPNKAMQINPAISICENGFNVSLPIAFCVLSPSLYAVYACANSCTERQNKSAGKVYKKDIKPSFENILNKIITPILYVYYIILFKICK